MKFKNYCVLFMGSTDGVALEIESISESGAKILDGKGVVISTFTSLVSIQEITAFFHMNNRSFFVFELDETKAGWHINRPKIQENLFGFLKNIVDLDEKTTEFLESIGPEAFPELTEEDIMELSDDEKDELFNKLIDNGPENLTEKDKRIMSLLTK